ncbi:MAG: UrcA family protein [Gammaproteobacteria bacterium]
MKAKSGRSLSGGLCAFGIAALCVAGLPSAHADGNDKHMKGSSTTVKFSDLNLQSPAGAEELYRRIERAANKVCWEPADQHILTNIDRRDCVERAVAKAVSDVNNSHLTALYARKTNKALG